MCGTVLGTGDTKINKTGFCLPKCHGLVGEKIWGINGTVTSMTLKSYGK